jgi:hypothetical protein
MTTLRGRYDDDRSLTLEPSANGEVTVKIGNQAPMFLSAHDLLLAVTRAFNDVVFPNYPRGKAGG